MFHKHTTPDEHNQSLLSNMHYQPIPDENETKTADSATTPFPRQPNPTPTPNQITSLNSEQGIELTLRDVLTASTLADPDFSKQVANIVQAFNKNIQKSCFTTSMIRGERVAPGEALLGHRNQVPELALFNKQKIALASIVTGPDTVLERSGKYKMSSPFFGTCGSFVVNVPPDKYAKAMSGNKPILLAPGPHVIHDAQFSFDPATDLIDQSSPYIQHGTIHIVRVPAGSIAKVWIGNTPYLLQSRHEPYVFNTPFFKLTPKKKEHKEDKEIFEDAASKLIVHGSLKRIIPRTGEVAITYDQGVLKIIDKPMLIASPMHNVDSFLDTNTKTLLLPSDSVKSQRKKENNAASADEVAYEIFQTKDSLKIGVKLCVIYRIQDPEKAISRLGKEGILPHIESLASADMANAIQQSTSSTYLSSYSNKAQIISDEEQKVSAPLLFGSIQDSVRDKLATHLKEYGVELVQLRFETPKIMNIEIAKKMEEQSLQTAKTNTDQALIDQQTKVATKQAEQEAQVLAIQQEQQNKNLISAAHAKLEAAKLETQALLVKSNAEQKREFLHAEVFRQSPEMFQLELAKTQASGLRNAQVLIVSSPNQTPWGNNPYTLFAATPSRAQANSPLVRQEEKEAPANTQ